MTNNTHTFKAGDKAIVLPSKSEFSDLCDYRGHYLQVFDVATIESVDDKEFAKAMGTDIYLGNPLGQLLQYRQLQPLPIPYHLLDAE